MSVAFSITKRLLLTGLLVVANIAILYVLSLFLSSESPLLEWAPGVLFGLAFASTNLKSRSEVISFTLLSGIAYWLAVEVAKGAASYGFDYSSSSTPTPWLVQFLKDIVDVVTPFGVGGVVGAAILTVSLKFLTNRRLSGYDLLIVLIGGLAGFAFWQIITGYSFPWPYLIWQLPVALALVISLPGDSGASDQASRSASLDRISRFLQTPIFVIIGVIVNLIALYEFVKGLVPR
jgi:putative flippase GtrA